MTTPSISLVNHLDSGELGALLQMSTLITANNTGPVHVAAAVGTPVVDLYALTNPQHTPWAVPRRILFHDVDCKYCYKSVCPEGHHNCLRLVSPHEVVQAALDLLTFEGSLPSISYSTILATGIISYFSQREAGLSEYNYAKRYAA